MTISTKKFAFITGASTGIGKALALELAKKGYFIFIAARNLENLNKVKVEIEKLGALAEVICMDLQNLQDIKDAVSKVKLQTSHIDILGNIAGVYHDDQRHFFGIDFENYPDEAIIGNIQTSLVGHILLTKHLLPVMSKGSCVINMSGTFDPDEVGVLPEYVTKKGIELFTKQLALEVANKGVRSNCVVPDYVFTENVQKFFPDLKKADVLDPVFVAQQIVGICENSSINGQIIEIKRS